MSRHRHYKIKDYRFGLAVTALREKSRLTQKVVADALNVSRRTIQHWEAGTTFPAVHNLKKMIALFLTHEAFTKDHEKEEIMKFWEQADESAKSRLTPFDHAWFDELFNDTPNANNERTKTEKTQRSFDTKMDWHDAPDVREIYGRKVELAELGEWVLEQNARFVVVLGMGGIGKTTLTAKFAQTGYSQFEYVIWRSLHNAPPLEQILIEFIQFLAPANEANPTIMSLLAIMRKHRCLLVLDNMETLHKPGSYLGEYRDGYEDYRTFFLQLAKSQHKSCVILTSRELPTEIEPLQGESLGVNVMRLAGLPGNACQKMLTNKGLFGSPESWDIFAQYYAGNPLALKIAASTVRQLFGGDLAAFLKEAPVTLHTLQHLLDSQFEHISSLEQEIMFWLAIERKPLSLKELQEDIKAPKSSLIAGLMALRQRSLVEREEADPIFYLLPVLREYVTNRFVDYICEEIENQELTGIIKYPLIKSKSREYVRESQIRMILSPILERLIGTIGNEKQFTNHLRMMVNRLRGAPIDEHGFAGGTLVNLLSFLNGHIRNEDFSRLALRQVYLKGIEAQDADFTSAEFSEPHFTEPIETIGAMTLSPKGNYLAVSSYSGQIHTWHIKDGTPLWTVSGVQREWTMSFNTDETILASGGYNGEICLWDASTGKLIKKVTGNRVWIYALAFQPDGERLATGGFYGSVRVWNTQDMSLQYVLDGHSSSVHAIAFSADGSKLVTSSRDGSIRIWDLTNGACLHTLQHGEPDSDIHIALQPNGNLLVSCSEEDSFIKLWDVETGKSLACVDSHSLGSISIAFDSQGKILARGNNQGLIELWKIDRTAGPQYFKSLIGHQHHVETLSFAHEGLLATLSLGGGIKLWDMRTGELLKMLKGYSRLVGATTFSPDGQLLIQGDANGMIRIWDLKSQRYLFNFLGHTGPIWKITVSLDGRKFATCADDRLVKLWDLNELKCLKTFNAHKGRLFELAFNPSGTLLASGGTDRIIEIWSTAGDNNVNAVRSLEGGFDMVWSLAFSPAGDTLASGHVDGEINLWNVDSETHLSAWYQAADMWGDLVGEMRFSDDGKYLFSSSSNELLRRWDVLSGECVVAPIKVPGNRNKAIAIGSKGTIIATGSKESDLCLWFIDEVGADPRLVRVSGHKSRIWGVALSPDEHIVASSDEEGVTLLTDLKTGTVLHRILLDRPYERMKIKGVKGLNLAERAALSALGAIE
ncbi:MAG: helix-turn-helix domain-containing protein [Ardenticatenaceae bacterium]|nr:helix-turn-helix domain-containing protein [Ardenticatenaceae bacterium]MCB9443436.1 helix-turn-helix domain-containing protein [Ardenticatenaceae bacterium]